MVDTSFEVPSFRYSESGNGSPYDIIKEYDSKIESLTKELNSIRFDRDRLKTAFELLSVYIKSLNF